MIARRARLGPAATRLGLWFAALALLVRIVVPAGFMPMATADGAPTLVICSGAGPMVMPMSAEMAMPMAGMGHDDKGSHDQGGDMAGHGCFLGAVGGAIAIAVPPTPILLPFVQPAGHIVAAFVARPGLGLAAPPPPKTGPPFLA